MYPRTLIAVLLALASTLMMPIAAYADDNDISSQLSYALETVPGGTRTAWNQVTWPDGSVLTAERTTSLARASSAATSTCRSGKFCAYSDINGSGSHLDFTGCPSSNSIAALPQVLSISNARSSGTVTARKASAVIVTAKAGVTKNVTKAVDKIVCAL